LTAKSYKNCHTYS